MKKLLAFIFSLILLAISTPAFASSNWQVNPSLCPATDPINFPGQNCTPNNICGDNGGIAQCYATASITPPVGDTTQTSAPYTTGITGGYLIDCNHSVSGMSVPYCNNGTTGFCNADNATYATAHKTTVCTGGAWNTFTAGSCRSGYQDCDATPAICEVQTGVTPQVNPHTVYAAGCGFACASGYIACAGNPDGSSATGCEIQVGGACTVGGVDGVYGPTCSGSGGNCITTPVHFITGINAVYSTSSALLWGTQNQTFGNLIDISASSSGAGLTMDYSGRLLAENIDGTAFSAENGGMYVGGATGLNIGFQRAVGDSPQAYFQDSFYQPVLPLEDFDTYVSSTLVDRIRMRQLGPFARMTRYLLDGVTYTQASAVSTAYPLAIHTTSTQGLLVVARGSTVNSPLLTLRDVAWDGKVLANQHIELSWSGSYKGAPLSNLITAYQDSPFGLGTGSKLAMYISSSTNPQICIGIDCVDPSYMLDVRGDIGTSNTIRSGAFTLDGSFADSVHSSGTSGQVLSSTGTSTRWISGVSLSGDNSWTGLNNFVATTTMSFLTVSSTASQVSRINFLGGSFGSDGWIGPANDGTAVFGISTVGSNPLHIYVDGVRKLAIGASSITASGNLVPNSTQTYDLGSSVAYWKDGYIGGTLSVGTSTELCATGLNSDGGQVITMWNQSQETLIKGTIVEPAQYVEYNDFYNRWDRWAIGGVTPAVHSLYWDSYGDTFSFFATTSLYSALPTSTSNLVAQATTTNIYGMNFWLEFKEMNSSGISGAVYITSMLMNADPATAGHYVVLPPKCSMKKATMSSTVSLGCLSEASSPSSTARVTVDGIADCVLANGQYAVAGSYVGTGGTGGMLDVSSNYTPAKPAAVSDTEKMMGWAMDSAVGNGIRTVKTFLRMR